LIHPVFIIYSPHYNSKKGGALILHFLCHYLNDTGYSAYIWPHSKKLLVNRSIREKLSYLKKIIRRTFRGVRRVSPNLNTPIAKTKNLENAIVVYPEKIAGNPLNASNVVRYALHVPGFFTGVIDYGSSSLSLSQNIANTLPFSEISLLK